MQWPQGADTAIKNKQQAYDEQFMELSPSDQNSLVKEFYKHQKGAMGEDFYFENDDALDSSDPDFDYASARKQLYEYKKGMGSSNPDFDLTAKEIASHKRPQDKTKPLVSERSSQSPMQSQTSRAETVKWAFSNHKDSQETQKKSMHTAIQPQNNPRDMISRSLKTHDSKKSEMPQQQTISSNNPQSIKGKMLDFENINSELESGILLHTKKSSPQRHLLNDNSEIHKDQDELISFLEDESDLMSQIRSNGKPKLSNYFVFKGLKKSRDALAEALQEMANNTMDCPLCNPQKTFDESLQISKIEETKTRTQIIQENLDRKYLTSREYYNVKIINDIIYNESTHIVSVFKDYLIFDDISEFLKRFYQHQESAQRLPKMFEFYEKFSKVFPNYVILPENKYMFKNIEKKQRNYDEKQRILQEQQEKKDGLGDSMSKGRGKHKDRFSRQEQNSSCMSQMSNNKMFNSTFINSVANIQPSGFIDSMMSSRIINSHYQDHVLNSSILIQQHLQQNMEKKKRNQRKGIEDLDLSELISKFIAKDSESNIQQSTIIMPEEKKSSKNVKQPGIYDYQVKTSQQITTDKSKQTDISGRPTSSKQKQSTHTRNGQPKEEQKGDLSAALKEGKMVNYNIYNNYNQFINNENYYISTEDAKSNPAQKENTAKPAGGSLSRTQSKPNLHVKSGEKGEQVITPSKTIQQTEVVSPNSGDRRVQAQAKNKKNYVKQQDQQDYFAQAEEGLQKQNTQNKSTTSVVYKAHAETNQSPIQVVQKAKVNTHAYPSGLNTIGVSGVTSRDQSKDRHQQSKPLLQNIKQQPLAHPNSQNQMFKKENIAVKQMSKEPSQKQFFNIENQDYNIIKEQSNNIRSVERLKQIEDEIEKDYSKYVNEYGLTKTAFAKAVNSLREKQMSQQQMYEQPPLTERPGKLTTQSSNEKGKKLNNMRSGSTSQSRKQSGSRQKAVVETANELYMNTNTLRQDSQKPIRSVRAKTHLSSQNSSSCFQKSQKMSPDKNYLISNNGQGNFMAFNQSTTPLQQTQQVGNYITLKAQPTKTSKGIKIKFPINTQRSNANNNNSNNQTPKRIKLQKTKSTSNIPIAYKVQSQASSNMPTQRNKVTDMMILDEMGNYVNSGSFVPTSNMTRTNQPFVGGSQVLNNINEMYQNDPNYQGLNPQQTFQSSSCGGTYVTTSILNSPLSFKNQPVAKETKVRGSSRNNNTQHQSQKSIGHQRTASATNNALQSSNGKKQNKRMSAGSNLSKKPSQPLISHQPSSSNVQQQLIQLLMSYQNQQESDSNIMPLSQTVRNLQSSQGMNSVSMKDLKSIKQATTNLLKDIQMVKPKNIKPSNQGALIQQTQNLQTQRLAGSQSSTLLMKANITKGSKSGKNTARGDSKKRKSIHNLVQVNEAPSTLSTLNQYSNYGAGHTQELSSRIASALQMGDSTYGVQDHKRIMSYSKSSENLDMIRMAAQRAAQEQLGQQASISQNQPKFLQNLKQQDNQFLMQKLRLVNNQQQPLQSARNLQYDSQQQPFQIRGSEYEHYAQSTKAPSNYILQQNVDKSQSRRTSGKFQPNKV